MTPTEYLEQLKIDLAKTVESNILLKAYPIGSIYMSITETSPAVLFGGTWERIKGRFLVGAGANEANSTDWWGTFNAGEMAIPLGELGGIPWQSISHTHTTSAHALTVAEIPKHAHKVYAWDSNNTLFTAYTVKDDGTGIQSSTMGGRLSNVSWNSSTFTTAGNSNLGVGHVSGTTGVGDPIGNTHFVGSGGSHSHGNTGAAGTTSLKTVPPFLAVCIWKRTA